MEIVQTGTGQRPWCMGMFGARFAVFVRRARVLPDPCPATRNLSFLRFHRHRHTVVSTRCFTGMVRVGVKIPQDGNRANRHGPVWRMLCRCIVHSLSPYFLQLVLLRHQDVARDVMNMKKNWTWNVQNSFFLSPLLFVAATTHQVDIVCSLLRC